MTQPLRLALIAPLLAALLLGTLPVPAAHAATFIVTKTADTADGTCNADCSLREAIIAANAAAGDDIITVPAGTYTLTIAGAGEDAAATGDLDITSNITINGAGAGSTIIQAGTLGVGGPPNGIDRVFHVTGGFTVNISGVTVRNGLSGNGGGCCDTGFGSGIYNHGTLTVTDSTFSGHSTAGGGILGHGGGIYNDGTLTVTNSTFSGNSMDDGSGGGIRNAGTLTVTNSTFSGNSVSNGGGILNAGTATVTNSTFSSNATSGGAGGYGGGIANGGTLTVTNSTFSGNTAGNSGGGITNGGTLTVTNSTFTGNESGGAVGDAGGGGIYNGQLGTLTVTNSTFSDNRAIGIGVFGAGGGIYTILGTATITNSTFSGNVATDGGEGALSYGGGIYSRLSTLTITNSTFSGNNVGDAGGSGGGIYRTGDGTVTLKNTIVANSTTGGNCVGTITDGGNNLQFGGSTANSCGATITTANPNLGALTGSPAYFPLNTGSPAIDAGTNTGCPTTSQNGVTRPADGDGNGTATCDIGSYEAPTAGGGGGGDPGPLVDLAVNGGSSDEVSATNPVAVTYRLRGCQGQEMFLVLNAPPMGIVWSYLNAAGQWMKLPANLADIMPFTTAGPADGGYLLFMGNVPPGDYELYLGCDFAKNGHLDYQAGGVNGVFDHILVHVR